MVKEMQFAVCVSTPDACEPHTMTLEQGGLHWLKLGHEYFCRPADVARPVDWSKLGASGLSIQMAPREAGLPDPGSLYLVTQEGRLFKRAYPDEPVLLDKGRYLLVSLDPRQADKIVQHQARFSVRPAAKNESIFETLTRPKTPLAMDSRTRSLVDTVSRTKFVATLAELASRPTRHSLSSHFQDVAKQARDQLQLMGYQVSLQNVRIPGGSTLNVIADKRGSVAEGRSLTLVCAHLDS